MEKFFMTQKTTKDIVWGWLEKGAQDLKSAEILLKSNENVMDVACYHCHQAVEKYLKGFLVFKKISFSKTHDLDYLLGLCVKEELAFSKIQKEIQSLSQYDSSIRYPEEETGHSLEEAILAHTTTENILKFIRALISV